jgi:hypothetical protein
MAKGERSCRVCPAPDRAVQALTFCRQGRFDVVEGPWLARRDWPPEVDQDGWERVEDTWRRMRAPPARWSGRR